MELVSSVPENKPYNKLGSAVNRIMCYYENVILQHAIHVINKKGIAIFHTKSIPSGGYLIGI